MDALEHIEEYQRLDKAIDNDREYEMVKCLCRELRAAREAVSDEGVLPFGTRTTWEAAMKHVAEKMKEAREVVEAQKSG